MSFSDRCQFCWDAPGGCMHCRPPQLPPAKKYPVVKVSVTAYDLVQDLEAALMHHMSASKDDAKLVDEAYAALNLRRKELYEYLHSLEFNAGVPLIHTLRFD